MKKKVSKQTQPKPPAILHALLKLHARMSHPMHRLQCYVAGSFTYISIRIDPSNALTDLKRLIMKKQKERFRGVDEDEMRLFQVRHLCGPCGH